jgi:type IX secretion system substrate protein
MFRCIALLILLSTRAETILAQPFDTIITRFQYLSQIYPLEDSTFILIGQKNGIVIERMNSKAEAIWTICLGNAKDDVLKSVVHCEVRDSSIQVYTARRDCDIYDGKDGIIYTLTFNGTLLDSLKVPYEYNPRYISLLSGNPDFPRLAYPRNSDASDPDVILMFHSGDTMHIRPNIPGLDTNNQSIIGKSVCVTLSPDSLILINTNGFFTFFFKKINGKFTVVDRSHATGWKSRDLFALEKDHFITVYEDYLILFHKDYEIVRISIPPQNLITSIKWQNPYLVLTQGNIFGKDSLFIYDKNLNVVEKRRLDDFRHYPFEVSYRNQTFFWTSQPHHYLEGAAIHSMNIDSMDGPGTYDVGIKDVNVPAYDGYTTAYSCSKIAYYHFPYIILTVVNHSETMISHIDVIQEYSCICPAWHWIKPIDNMDLQPGETDTFWLRDVTIANVFGTRYPLEFCLDIIHPDFHRDVNPYPDNYVCETITLRESYPFAEEEIIRYFPNPVAENLTLYTEDTISYDLDVFDTNGRYVYETQQFKGGYGEIDVSSLPQGVYYLRFRFRNGITTQGAFTKL